MSGDYSARGDDGEVKQKIAEMASNGSGIRNTARVLKISRNTIAPESKKLPQIQQVDEQFLPASQSEQMTVSQGRVESCRT